MTSIYISSTYNDLIKHREAVVQTVLKMKKIVVSMEHYTASDERPLDKCLTDVAECDIYIGIFAFRYGFVPNHDNPDNLSITELEHQQARRYNKPCLIFIADEIGWPMTNSDFYTGESDRGTKIKELRDQLNHDHTRSLFKSPEDLAASVSAAVANLLEKNQPVAGHAVAEKAALAAPLPREIASDLFLAYSDVEAGFIADLADYLNSRKVRTILDQRALFASTADDFVRLERSACSCHAAAVLVSDTSLRQLEERRKAVTSVFGILEARTENLFAICRSDESARKMTEWPLGTVERATGWKPREAAPALSLNDRLESLRLSTGLDSAKHWVGLPVIVVAMTRREADETDANPVLIRDRLGQAAYQRFMDLRTALAASGFPIANKYGARRLDCRPFVGLDVNIAVLLKTIIERLNDDQPSQLRGRLIKLQNYQFDELISHGDELSPIFTQLSSTGCVLVLDEYSLFYPEIQEALVSSGLLANDQVALVTLSPTNPYSTSPFDMLEAELRKRMAAAFNRFASTFDPQCELSVGDEKRLKRWLNASLPHTIQSLRNPKPNRQNISQFAREQGIDPQPKIAPLLYTEGGPL
jgi:hypothetical protein